MGTIYSYNNLGKTPQSLKCVNYFFIFPSDGLFTYLGNMYSAIAQHIQCTMSQTVEIPVPNKAEIVQYSTLVANLHIVTAIRWSTGIGIQNLVMHLAKYGYSSMLNFANVLLVICKFSVHQFSPNSPALIASQYS